jgi:hypothetical protein
MCLFDLTQVYWFIGTLVITLGFSFVMSLLFEAPFLGLEKIIFAPCLSSTSSDTAHKGANVMNGDTSKLHNGLKAPNGFHAKGKLNFERQRNCCMLQDTC